MCSFDIHAIHTTKEHHMSFYDATVPVFIQVLGALTGLLNKAEAHCKAKNIKRRSCWACGSIPTCCR